MIRFLDYGLGGTQGVTNDEIRQIGVIERHGTQEHCLFLGPNAQGQAAVVFDCYSGHGGDSSRLCTHSNGTSKNSSASTLRAFAADRHAATGAGPDVPVGGRAQRDHASMPCVTEPQILRAARRFQPPGCSGGRSLNSKNHMGRR
jgi:hypothetical protein